MATLVGAQLLLQLVAPLVFVGHAVDQLGFAGLLGGEQPVVDQLLDLVPASSLRSSAIVWTMCS